MVPREHQDARKGSDRRREDEAEDGDLAAVETHGDSERRRDRKNEHAYKPADNRDLLSR